MAVTITPSTLLEQIKNDFPLYNFVAGDDYRWSARHQQITFRDIIDIEDIGTLLHELGHAEQQHDSYQLDIELIRLEREAWAYAQKILAPRYGLKIDSDFVEDHLDTYRIWLHQRSKCPQCGLNGFQTTKNTYSCNNCRCLWRVNEARMCRLRRVKLQDQNHSS